MTIDELLKILAEREEFLRDRAIGGKAEVTVSVTTREIWVFAHVGSVTEARKSRGNIVQAITEVTLAAAEGWRTGAAKRLHELRDELAALESAGVVA